MVKIEYNGTIQELKTKIKSRKVPGGWYQVNNAYQFKESYGGIMNFFPGTGTLQFQGRKDHRERLYDAIRGIAKEEIECEIETPWVLKHEKV